MRRRRADLSRLALPGALPLAVAGGALACAWPGDRTASAPVVTLHEAFVTERSPAANLDSVAVWRRSATEAWIVVTAKEGNALFVYDAGSGAFVRQIGAAGSGPGQLSRPNGVAVVDDLAIVTERDNRRVQVFRLPDGESLGTFGAPRLRRPYGLTVFAEAPGKYAIYLTDNYETPDEQIPPDRELGARVQQFRFWIEDGAVRSEWVRAFGDTSGPGVLRKVESIRADPAHDRLLIADEDSERKDLKVYALDGRFTGRTVGEGLFEFEPEGLALYRCGESDGYWIAADQDDRTNTFHVLDRATFAHRGAFAGKTTRNTDGVALTQGAVGPLRQGALYAVHDDSSVSAFAWEAISAALDLTCDDDEAPPRVDD